MKRSLLVTMAIASGLAAANLYYCQPLLNQIAHSLHVTQAQVGILPPLNQVGYATGLLLLVPLGDILERRRVIIVLFGLVTLWLLLAANAPTLTVLAIASYLTGVTTIMAQMLLPFAITLSKPEERGKVVGSIMSGLLLGILLSRTVSGFVGDTLGWRWMYGLAACVMVCVAMVLRVLLPESPPQSAMSYFNLLRSVVQMAREQPVLRQSAFSGGILFACFSAFWATLVFLLASPAYGYGPKIAGLFGLVGAAGALAAPVTGRLADTRSPRLLVGLMLFLVLASYVFFLAFGLHLWGLIIGVIALDWGVQAGHVANQTRVYALVPGAQSRLNTVYMSSYFIGGSCGSYLGALGWSRAGWNGVCAVGIGFACVGLLAHFLANVRAGGAAK